MERGAERFFTDLPDSDRRVGRAADHLRRVVVTAVQALERHPDFLRLLVAFAVQPSDAGNGQIDAVVGRVREVALTRLRKQIALAFQDDPRSATTDQLARFALAAFDGAFVASQSDRGVTSRASSNPSRLHWSRRRELLRHGA